MYAPEPIGTRDILIAGSRIAAIEEDIDLPANLPGAAVVDCRELTAVPGLIDSHVHIIGGGGEGGFQTRTPEITLGDILLAGVTTLVGVRGTDGFTRSMEALVAKAKEIETHGLTCRLLTGSYQVPVRSLTGSVEKDIILIHEIIGAGEIAMADHRASQRPVKDIINIAAMARVGGMLSGKPGIVNIHMGDGQSGLSPLIREIQQSDVPIRHFIPTHINRSWDLLLQGFDFVKAGGFIDLTASGFTPGIDDERTKCSRAFHIAVKQNTGIDRITFSSDGQGSLPVFDRNSNVKGQTTGSCSALLSEVRDMVNQEGIPLETALLPVTLNPARMLQMPCKGRIAVGSDADILLLDSTLSITALFARGKSMNAS